MFFLLTADAAGAEATQGLLGGGLWMSVLMLVIMFAFFWFAIMRPQKKEEKRINAMHASMEIGDSIMTTGGFYGVIIDITDEDVIVEFGNNKNCRIPMKKTAIAQLEKAESNL